jgi:UV DNA damage endonuclease
MAIGYACIALGVPDTRMKNIRLKNAGDPQMREVIAHNLYVLESLIEYNSVNRIALFRISSDLIPLASHRETAIDWVGEFSDRLAEIGMQIRSAGIRVSMHPGQYCVLNAADPEIVVNAKRDLQYHCAVLDHMGMDAGNKIILHIGGSYGDKKAAAERFKSNFLSLDPLIRRRIAIENDENRYHIGDVLEIGRDLRLPVVFDVFHDKINPSGSGKSDYEITEDCAGTWMTPDGKQKIHYSQQGDGRKGSHSETISLPEFLDFYNGFKGDIPDIMLEVKDKNISALKCIYSVTPCIPRKYIETEWARYKYRVMSRSAAAYAGIGGMFHSETDAMKLARGFYLAAGEALKAAPSKGAEINAALHVWGYFKNTADEAEKKSFQNKLDAYDQGTAEIKSVKNLLYKLALKYNTEYLIRSYYFL